MADAAPTGIELNSLVDVHVHLMPLDDSAGAYASPAFTWTRMKPLTRTLKITATKEGLNHAYAAHVATTVRTSKFVRQAVILGMDGVYRRDGSLDRTHTQFYVPDDFVLDVAAAHPDVLMPGVSVSPRRPHALDALTQAAEAGAVLVKWLPNTMHIDPGHPDNDAFFRRLVDHGLPLLTHVGHEFSVPGAEQRYGDPSRLRRALEAGVTVIAAHAGSSGLPWIRTTLPRILHLMERYPNLYLDTSASIANRAHVFERLARRLDIFDRLLFASDYPVMPTVPPGMGALSWTDGVAAYREPNWLDRHARIQHALGMRWDPDLPQRVLREAKRMTW